MNQRHTLLRSIGSMWFAVILLLTLLIAMACATIFESTHGAERALADFYASWWFQALFGLLALNVLSAMLARYPYSRRQIGFLMTHTAILVIFAGALVTRFFGVDGRVAVREGQTISEITLSGQPVLMAMNRSDGTKAALDLDPDRFRGFEAVEDPDVAALTLGQLRIDVARYLPDSTSTQRVVDDNPAPRPAVEVSLSPDGRTRPTWVFARQTARLGTKTVVFRILPTAEDLRRLIDRPQAAGPHSKGTLKIERDQAVFEIPLDRATDEPAPIGDSGYRVRVIRYLPHATVGAGGKVTNVSPRPVNPYVEAEIIGPDATEHHRSFARFPNFASMHGGAEDHKFKLTFVAETDTAPTAPIEIIGGPGGKMYARFTQGGKVVVSEPLQPGVPVETPWPEQRFTLLRRFNHARLKQTVEPVTPVRKERTPAILLTLKTSDHTNEMWVLKDRSYPVSIEGVPHEVAFTDKTIPLGFSVTLDRFRVGYYPGTGRPRSFQSNMTITDPAGGRELSRVVSMNNPTSYGGYTFYQSSYDQRGAKALSILSVSRDPGQPIVFAGYFLLIAGMLWVLVLRMRERSRTQRTENAAARPPVVRPRLDDTVREPTPEPAPAPAGSNGEHLRSTEPTERDPETDYTFQR